MNKQSEFWSGQFGNQYTDRNINIDNSTFDKFGITRSSMNQQFLSNLDIANVLEVGCNRGEQLNLLWCANENIKDFYGIDINEYALYEARKNNLYLNFIKGSALDIPFKDNQFDLVFTSGVLIHISPESLKQVMSEIYRVSKKYIFGFEYFSEYYQDIEYRGQTNVLWKGNFCEVYQRLFLDLKLVKQEFYKYQDNSGNVDSMFLLEKTSISNNDVFMEDQSLLHMTEYLNNRGNY
jgi:pseudaminic acid biosynthesis-associated methylase